ncbi:MAG: (2Fe-2S)-binding protein [Pseudomonadota bacterium]
MYVCLCNAVTESEVREACDQGAETLSDLQDSLGVAMGCGQCAPTCCAMLEGKDAMAAIPASASTAVSGSVIRRA